MNLVDLVVLRRAEEQVQEVRRLAGPESGRCECGKPLRSPGKAGPKPVTCGARACVLARKAARQRAAYRRAS